MSSVTNAEQFKYMVDWMCEHRDIGRGFPRNLLPQIVVKNQIEELVVELNRLGPPVKPIETWRKVWADYRNSTKRKFREHYTKERIHRFNELEERVIELMELRDQTGQLIQERFERKRAFTNRNANLKRKHTNDDDFDDDYDEYEMGEQESEFIDMNTNSEESKNMSDEDIKNISDEDIKQVSQIEKTAKTPNTSVTTTSPKESVTPIAKQPLQQASIQMTRSATNASGAKANGSDSRVQMATLRVLQRIERQLNRLNDTEERNVNIMEENNKLLKLLIFRTTMNKKNHETDEETEDHK